MPTKKARRRLPRQQSSKPDTLEARFELLLEREGMPAELPLLLDRRNAREFSVHGLPQKKRPQWADDNLTDEERLDRLIYTRLSVARLMRQESLPELEATIEVERDDGPGAPGELATRITRGHSYSHLHIAQGDFWRDRWSRALLIVAEHKYQESPRWGLAQRNTVYDSSRRKIERIARLVVLTDYKFGPWFVHQRRRPKEQARRLRPGERRAAEQGAKIALHYIALQEPCRVYIGRLTFGSRSTFRAAARAGVSNRLPDHEAFPLLARRLRIDAGVVARVIRSWRRFIKAHKALLQATDIDEALGLKPGPWQLSGPPLRGIEVAEKKELLRRFSFPVRDLDGAGRARLIELLNRELAHLQAKFRF